MKCVLFIAAVFSLIAACAVAPVPVGTTSTFDTPTRTTSTAVNTTPVFTELINDFRSIEGLGGLTQEMSLTHAAQAHADDMLARDYFSHEAPNGPNGRTFNQRAIAAGCVMRAGAENIAIGQQTEAEVLNAWANSRGHRRNMLGSTFTLYGLGRAGTIWVLKLAADC